MGEYTWSLPKLWNEMANYYNYELFPALNNYPQGVQIGTQTRGVPKSDNLRFANMQHLNGVSIPVNNVGRLLTPEGLINIGKRNFAKELLNNNGVTGLDMASILTSGALFGMGMYDSFLYNKSVDDMNMQAGQTGGISNGVGYRIQKIADRDRELSEVNRQNTVNLIGNIGKGAAFGATVGSVVPGLGTALGGIVGGAVGGLGSLLGGKHRKDSAQEILDKLAALATRTNLFNRDVAATTGMQMDFKRKYGDLSRQMLYTAAKGKPFGLIPGKFGQIGLISTPNGVSFGIPNAIGHNNEPMFKINEDNSISATTVKTGSGNGENAPVYADDRTVMFGNNISSNGETYENRTRPLVEEIERINKTISSIKDPKSREVAEKASTNRKRQIGNYLSYLANEQEMTRPYNNYTNLPHAKYGKDLPKTKLGGWLPNFLANGFNIGTGIALYFDAKNQDVFRPNSYVRNPYETRALADLDSLRIDPYAILQQMHNAERRGRFSISKSGGLSTGLKLLANVATTANSQNNYANALMNIDKDNLAYRMNAAQLKFGAGATDAKNLMASIIADNDVYMKSIADKLGGMQTGLYNISNGTQNYMANEDTRQWRNALVDMWSADLRDRRNSIS